MCRATFHPVSYTFSFVFSRFSCKTAPADTYTPHPGHSHGGDITKGGLRNTHGGSLLSSSNTILPLPTCTCVGNDTAHHGDCKSRCACFNTFCRGFERSMAWTPPPSSAASASASAPAAARVFSTLDALIWAGKGGGESRAEAQDWLRVMSLKGSVTCKSPKLCSHPQATLPPPKAQADLKGQYCFCARWQRIPYHDFYFPANLNSSFGF